MAPSVDQHRTRRIFLIVVDDGIEVAVYLDTGTGVPLQEPINMLVQSRINDGQVIAERIGSIADCTMWDYSMNRLPDDIEVRAVPAPGVVYVVAKGAETLGDLGLVEPTENEEPWTPFTFRTVVDLAIRTNDSYGPRIERFLTSPDALFEPDPMPTYDVFISFSATDFLHASDLAMKLSAQGAHCFLANTSIAPGSLWAEELRIALRSSRRLLLVASPHAQDSSWVMSEIGAAWVLELPVLVARTDDTSDASLRLLESLGARVVTLDEVTRLSEFSDLGSAT